MELKLEQSPSAVGCHVADEKLLAVGHLDGSVVLQRFSKSVFYCAIVIVILLFLIL